MKMRIVLSLLVFAGVSAGMLDAASKKPMKKKGACPEKFSKTPGKAKKGEGTFDQRSGCARAAMMRGDKEKAFEIMAPVYNLVKTTKSNVKDDLRLQLLDIVKVAIGQDNSARLKSKYKGVKAEDLYAAVTLAYNIDPQTGATIKGGKKRHYTLPVGLEAEIRDLVTEDVGSFLDMSERLYGEKPSTEMRYPIMYSVSGAEEEGPDLR